MSYLYNIHVKTNSIQSTPIEYNVKFTKIWQTTPKVTPTSMSNDSNPLPNTHYHIKPPKYNPQQCIYTNGLFIPSDKLCTCTLAGSRVYIPKKWSPHCKKDSLIYQTSYEQNYMPSSFLEQLQKNKPQHTFIFTDNLNHICLIGNHIWHPSSQHDHPGKLLMSTLVHQILWTKHNIII